MSYFIAYACLFSRFDCSDLSLILEKLSQNAKKSGPGPSIHAN
jgi:hypothetical protein